MTAVASGALSSIGVFQKIAFFGAPNSLGATSRSLRIRENEQYACCRARIYRHREHFTPKLQRIGKAHLLHNLFTPGTSQYDAAMKTRRFLREVFGREKPGDEIPTIFSLEQKIDALSKPDAEDIKIVWKSVAYGMGIAHPFDLDTLVDETAETLFTDWVQTMPHNRWGQTIVLSDPSLKHIPDALTLLPGLWELTIENCPNLVTIPESMDRCRLNHITLKNCPNLVAIPERLFNIPHLFRVDIDNCDSITEIPETVGNSQRLHHFHLTNCNGIVTLPESFTNMNQGQRLSVKLSGNHNLRTLPQNIENMQYVFLDISDLPSLTTLPDSIGQINASSLICRDCSALREIPDTFAGNARLSSLDFSGCTSLTHIPESIAEMTQVPFLNISRCSGLDEIPVAICERIHPGRINFSHCPLITEVPDARIEPFNTTLQGKEFDSELSAKHYSMFRVLKSNQWATYTLPKNYYQDFVERACVEEGRATDFTRLIWLNPKSTRFDTEAAQILPPALQNRIFRIIVSILVNIITLGILKHFSNPLHTFEEKITITPSYFRYVPDPNIPIPDPRLYEDYWEYYRVWGLYQRWH